MTTETLRQYAKRVGWRHAAWVVFARYSGLMAVLERITYGRG